LLNCGRFWADRPAQDHLLGERGQVGVDTHGVRPKQAGQVGVLSVSASTDMS